MSDAWETREWFRALPSVPDFPIYGLEPAFTGLRALALWDQPPPQPLWRVELHHGQPDLRRGPAAVVITVAKLPARGMHGATSIDDAAGRALLWLLHAQPDPDFSRPAVAALMDLAEHLDAPPWSPATAVVDSAATDVRLFERGGLWVAAADMDPVALAVFGVGMDPEDLALVPVNDCLDDYATG